MMQSYLTCIVAVACMLLLFAHFIIFTYINLCMHVLKRRASPSSLLLFNSFSSHRRLRMDKSRGEMALAGKQERTGDERMVREA